MSGKVFFIDTDPRRTIPSQKYIPDLRVAATGPVYSPIKPKSLVTRQVDTVVSKDVTRQVDTTVAEVDTN